jgi:hypothetical protein
MMIQKSTAASPKTRNVLALNHRRNDWHHSSQSEARRQLALHGDQALAAQVLEMVSIIA